MLSPYAGCCVHLWRMWFWNLPGIMSLFILGFSMCLYSCTYAFCLPSITRVCICQFFHGHYSSYKLLFLSVMGIYLMEMGGIGPCASRMQSNLKSSFELWKYAEIQMHWERRECQMKNISIVFGTCYVMHAHVWSVAYWIFHWLT